MLPLVSRFYSVNMDEIEEAFTEEERGCVCTTLLHRKTKTAGWRRCPRMIEDIEELEGLEVRLPPNSGTRFLFVSLLAETS